MDIRIKREDELDFIKGLLIFSVIYGHMITALKCGESFYVFPHIFIRIFDMPLFAFISGMLLANTIQRYSIWECFKKKIFRILLPAIIWNIIWDIISALLICGRFVLSFDYFWFLWAIFKSLIIVIIIGKISDYNKMGGVIISILAVCLTHMGWLTKFHVGFILFPCIVGYYYKKNESHIFMKTKYKILIIIIFCSGLLFWDGNVSIWIIGCNIFKTEDYLGNSIKMIYRGYMAILGCFIFMSIFKLIHEFLKSKMCYFDKFIIEIGKASLGMYVIQTLVVEQLFGFVFKRIVSYLGFNIFTYNTDIMIYLIAPIFTVIAIVIIYRMQLLLKRTEGWMI